MSTSPDLRVIGTRPDVPAGLIMNASRPLHGWPCPCELLGHTVVLSEPLLATHTEQANRNLGALVVEWISAADALAELTAHVQREYDDDGLTALEAMPERDQLMLWAQLFSRRP